VSCANHVVLGLEGIDTLIEYSSGQLLSDICGTNSGPLISSADGIPQPLEYPIAILGCLSLVLLGFQCMWAAQSPLECDRFHTRG
jgi:hypothetical protein